MKPSICCLIFVLLTTCVVNGQVKEFLKKEKPKYSLPGSRPSLKSTRTLQPAPFNIFAIPKPVAKPFFYHLPKGYTPENENGFLFVGSLIAGEIFRTVMADKMHARYPTNPAYFPYGYYLYPYGYYPENSRNWRR